MKHKVPQFELGLDGDTFQLVGEKAEDTERISAEKREAESDREQSAERQASLLHYVK